MSTDSLSTGQARQGRQNAFLRYLARFDDGEVMRWAFRGLLVGAIAVLALDLRDLVKERGGLWPSGQEASTTPAEPVLPPAPAVKPGAVPSSSDDPRRFVETDDATLRRPASFVLEPNGVLALQGSIDSGAAARLKDELDARGEYVRTVSINSPGGSLDDAMAMARMLRERGLATRVEDGAICASSCPLLMAGGAQRSAGAKAAIGVHQFYAVGNLPEDPAQAMADAQMTTARITRHLSDMGVDPGLWLHALDTPPQSLYYFTPDEMADYSLTTSAERTARR